MAYIPHTSKDREEMLKTVGVKSINELFSQIPEELRLHKKLDLPPGLSEGELSAELAHKSDQNTPLYKQISFLGGGAYDHYIPAVVDTLSLRGEFFTAYTPYQAEASQGNLQAFYEFQSLLCRLTQMEVANASLYDGATALAESVLMARQIKKGSKILLSSAVHPEYKEVVRTYLEHLPKSEIVEFNGELPEIPQDTCCVIFQSPNFFGSLEDGSSITEKSHEKGALAIAVVADPLSLSLVAPPGDYSADIVCGEAQSLGNPLCLGGPSLGFITTKKKYIRKIPGRIVGETVDQNGKRAYVLTLQTREQHIRREKATSNICSNQALLALRTAIYLGALGKQGFLELGQLCYHRAHYLWEKLSDLPGFSLVNSAPFFREFAIQCPCLASEIVHSLEGQKIIPGLDLGRFYPEKKNQLLVAVSEKNTRPQLDTLVAVLSKWK